MENNVPKNRIAWIDNIRLFAILCVILYHSSQLVDNKVYFGWIIESFNMPLFFFLSGFTSEKSLLNISGFKGLYDFVKKRFVRIMLPCIFVSMLIFQKPCSYWFLLTLFYYLVAFAGLKYICGRCKLGDAVLYILFALLTFIKMPVIGNNQEFVWIFTLGIIASKYKIFDMFRTLKPSKQIQISIVLLTCWICLLPFYESFYIQKIYDLLRTGSFHTFLLRQIMAFSFVIGCCIYYLNKRNYITRISEWGGQTMGMYIVHVTILKWCEKYNVVYTASDPIVGDLMQLLAFALLTIITLIIVRILRLWSWTNFLVLGNKLR